MAARRVLVPAICLATGLLIAGTIWLGSAASPSAGAEDSIRLELVGQAAWDGVTLELRSVVGDITIEGQPNAEGVQGDIQRIAKARSEPIAQQMLDTSRPFLRWNDDQTVVIAGTDQPPDSFGSAELMTAWTISLPTGMRVSIRNDVGDVRVAGMLGDVVIRTDVGDVTVRGSAGAVTAIVDVGDVRTETTGQVTAQAGTGTVWINGVEQTSATALP